MKSASGTPTDPMVLPEEPPGGVTAGVDWARDDHAVSVVDDRGRELDRCAVAHTAAGLRELVAFLRGHGVALRRACRARKDLVNHRVAVAIFLALAFPRFGARARIVGLLAAMTVFGLVVVVQLVGFPWYFGSHLGLDNGIGG